MIVTNIRGNLQEAALQPGQTVDCLPLDYLQAQKRILRGKTNGGVDVAIRLTEEAQKRGLHHGDILYRDETYVIAIEILPEASLRVKPRDAMELARFCYEVGNRHAPLYSWEDADTFAVLYDESMELLLHELGIPYEKAMIRLEEEKRMRLVKGAHHHSHPGVLHG
ncbi:urease accessory protein UreE [Selenomonas caprae]|uniref:Urease accessory protein UreE n=1 Tax=Selenomonas caprae TaxID=2606905 RepID=A0A5D6WE81_9FIRM|nr:urease accessory protein UreE [Selenomonas caprae]TYZ26841.1 urease accessory protein UreE [Selenomonas caprae]